MGLLSSLFGSNRTVEIIDDVPGDLMTIKLADGTKAYAKKIIHAEGKHVWFIDDKGNLREGFIE